MGFELYDPAKDTNASSPSGPGSQFNWRPTQTKKKGHHGIGGFLENLAGDVKDVTYGQVPGLINAASAVGHDIADLPNIRVSGTRVHGTDKPFHRTADIGKAVGEQYKQNYGSWGGFKHALYNDPLFVALDALTVLSAGATGAAKTGLITSKAGGTTELLTAAGERVPKTLARKELRAQFQDLTSRAMNAPVTIRGRNVRPQGLAAAKQQAKTARRIDANRRAQGQQFDRAVSKLKKQPEKIAAYLRAKYDREALDAYLEHLKTEGATNEAAFKSHALFSDARVQELFDHPTEKVAEALRQARELEPKQAELLGLDPAAQEAARFRPAQIAHGGRYDPETGTITGGPSIDELKARGHDPIYMPDVSTAQPVIEYGGKGGGKAVPITPGNARRNTGKLQLVGQIIADPSTLSQSFLKATKYAHYSDIHDELLLHAIEGDRLPPGWEFIRRKRSERIPATLRQEGDFQQWADANLREDLTWKSKEDGLTTEHAVDAQPGENGGYLMVPKKVSRKLAGEFTRQNEFFHWMNRYPLRVWRALILGLRPAYLVNNMVGNTLMYVVHSGKPEDLKQLAVAFKEFVKKGERNQVDALLERHFAGQVHGGFVATQMPELKPKRLVTRGANAVVTAIPKLDRRWEQALRRAKVKAELKKHPALRAHAERMGLETSYFERIEPVLAENPGIVEQVYERVNDALGNYDTMSAIEKGTLRNIFPFYAWFKAITVVSGKLAIEQPLKVNILARLGEIAVNQNLQGELQKDEIPASMLGFIPTGPKENGRIPGFNTGPLNPYGTVGQLADFGVALLSGKPGEAGKALPGANPFATDLINYIWGTTPAGYPAKDVPGFGTVESLPQKRLWDSIFGTHSPNTLYAHNPLDEFLRYLGVPYARVNPTTAKKIAR